MFTKQTDCFQSSLASREQVQDRLKLHDLKISFQVSLEVLIYGWVYSVVKEILKEMCVNKNSSNMIIEM